MHPRANNSPSTSVICATKLERRGRFGSFTGDSFYENITSMGFLQRCANFSRISKNVPQDAFTTPEILHALFGLLSFLPLSHERGNFSDIGDVSREFFHDLTRGSSFPFLLRRSRESTLRKYYTTIPFCYFNVAQRREEVYVPRRITFAHKLMLQVADLSK